MNPGGIVFEGENMSSRIAWLVALVLLSLSASSLLAARPDLQLSDGPVTPVPSSPVLTSRVEADTLLLMGPWGSGAPFNGQFQNQTGQPHWNAWTHRDLTIPEEANHWQAHNYNAAGLAGHGADNLAAWCGSLDYPSCYLNDEPGGYGNYWNDALVWTAEVADPSVASVVSMEAWLNLDTEPGYDYLSLLLRTTEGPHSFTTVAAYDGLLTNEHLSWEIEIPAGEYFGPEGNLVELRLVFTSDSLYSDEDCLHATAGPCQIDDITVSLNNGNFSTFDDFEDGTLGSWVAVDALGSGDFSQLRKNLTDVDGCRVNSSSQVCFIDDGVVVPGTGGTFCVDWCYGPGGYIVNWSGGLVPNSFIENAVISPVIPWPENHDGGLLDFDVYVHETLASDSPAILYTWQVRSTSDPDPAAIVDAFWGSDNFYYYGGPEYRRHSEDLIGLIEPGATFVQVEFTVLDYHLWGWDWAPNGTPAPYFDNVRISAVDPYGPNIVVRQDYLANDSFPESGVLDPENLASNNVRFDSGHYDDSALDALSATIVKQGEGTELGVQALHYRLIPNAVFDPVRTSGWPNRGSVPGTSNGNDSYSYDLPDSGFFYPGDVIHYYFTASQETPHGVESVMVPADTSGFSQNPWGTHSNPPGICAYDELFSVRALPSMDPYGYHPPILVWDDSGDPRFTASLRHDVNQSQAFADHGGMDLYRRLNPGNDSNFSRVATAEILAGYQAVFYFSGSHQWRVLGHSGDAGQDDLELLTQWLEDNPNRGLFLTGDHVLEMLDFTPAGEHILNDYLGATFVDEDIFPLIQNSTRPTILKMEGAPYLSSNIDQWYVPGYCPDSRTINAVQALEGAVRLAEFANPMGQGGVYPYAAMLANEGPSQSLCFSMPYDLRRIQHLPGWDGGGVSLRSRILGSVASSFNGMGFPWVDMTPAPDRLVLSASSYPNPFNPSTTISFNLPYSGHLNLKIFNIRGELVQTLADEPHEAGPGRIVWSGKEQSGGQAASGVYFYELRFGDELLTEKMMLLK